ncbi:MAG: thiamine pyrophosphate-dependent enzyme [Thermoleophilia bacterium]|nr:thiamine pyrophosphate-dependent enzyme [Thermoleophilia bacterium]
MSAESNGMKKDSAAKGGAGAERPAAAAKTAASAVKLGTYAKNTWCPGCGNFAILNAIKAVFQDLIAGGTRREDIVVVADIGCSSKIMDYIGVNSFDSLHGRAIPTAVGVKLANPGLTVVVHAGDGGAYAEGLEHLVFAAQRNADITVIVHDNGVYGLTIGQAGPMTPPGYKGRSTPYGSESTPFNPLELLHVAGATWLGRGYTHGIPLLKKLYREAIAHPGFSLVDTLQVCVTFRNMYESYNERVYELEGHDPRDETAALARIREWDYASDGPVALGHFLTRERPVFAEGFAAYGGRIDVESAVAEVFAELT